MASRLFYLMGPPGAGKDSLLGYVRAALTADDVLVIAHRYISRLPGGEENHVALTPAEFDLRDRAGVFAFSWTSHGYRYGIGAEIELWRQAGLDVIVNGSREAFDRIRAAGHTPIGILVTASEATLRARLLRRGRESPAEVESRLERNRALGAPDGVRVVANDGRLEAAGAALLGLLRGERARATY